MNPKMKRPPLDSRPLPTLFPEPRMNYMTCSPGQWNHTLQAGYDRGWTLLEIEEVNGEEKAVRAWKKKDVTP